MENTEDIEPVLDHRKLQPGDHIIVERERMSKKFHHHGIVLSIEEGVADFGASSDLGFRITSFFEFIHPGSNPACILRIKYHPGKCRPPKVVVDTAREVMEDGEQWPKYHLTQNNCEHFARYCKTGKKESVQIDEIKKKSVLDHIRLELCGSSCNMSSGKSFNSTSKMPSTSRN